MGPEDRDSRGWGRRLDGLIKRVGDEVGGERGERVRERLTQAKSRVEAGLDSEEARRVRGEMTAFGDKAMEHVDNALRHERTQQVVKQVDATLTEIGDRLRGEHTEPPTSTPPPRAPAARSEAATAKADDAADVRNASSEAGDVSPETSTDGEDRSPAKSV